MTISKANFFAARQSLSGRSSINTTGLEPTEEIWLLL